jgi:septum formation protein
MREIILASGSPRRRELLKAAGIPFVIKTADTDEHTDRKDPESVVSELSKRKCLNVAADGEDGIYLGADTVVACGDPCEILGKPADEADAVRMISMLQGGTHQVWTGVTMTEKQGGAVVRSVTEAVKTDVAVAPMTEDEIRFYVSTKEPMDKAGAYGIQGLFSRYIEKIDGSYANVVGLPVHIVYKILRMWGIPGI